MTEKLFLSHAHDDKRDAQALRRMLEDNGLAVWEDVLELRAGDRLNDIEQQVKSSRGLILLWTAAANESEWIEREAAWARDARRENPSYKILVVLRGMRAISARRLLGEELVFIPASDGVETVVPAIRRALDERAASGRLAEAPSPPPLIEELVISFSDARIDESHGRTRAAGRFRIEHKPVQGAGSRSAWMDFESPFGPIEIGEIHWYLELYPGWPFGTFRDRARRVELKLPEWGRALYDLTIRKGGSRFSAWSSASGGARSVVVEVDDIGSTGGATPSQSSGTAALLAIPWELLADEDGYLFEGGLRARIVRRIPREQSLPPLPMADRLRVLLVIARPEEEGVSFLDPRASARPLIEAIATLGNRAELEVLVDGTLQSLRAALMRAEASDSPFHVIHFDGPGIYDKTVGLGKLYFEESSDANENKLDRRADAVDADQLGSLLRERRVPLFVLAACQAAAADEKVSASVAARLLRAGVGSVVAMTNAVKEETARRFVGRFYERLADGERIGTAMVEAEHFLRDDPGRGKVGGYGALELQDWFVPVLFQEEEADYELLQAGVRPDQQDIAAQRAVCEGELPPTPAHGFVGRARELLAIQRLLRDRSCVAILGEGGQGKSTLAVECARWLLDLRRCERVAFATMEDQPDARLLLERLGRQLVPGYSAAKEEGTGTAEERLRRACLPIERVLGERRALLVVDNFESVLPVLGQQNPVGLDEVLALIDRFLRIGPTRMLITSREAPPVHLGGSLIRIGGLSKLEGRALVAGVLARLDRSPAGEADVQWVDDLVDLVGGRARSLVLLAPVIAERGFRVTADSVKQAMAELEKRHPGARELSLLASVRVSLDRLGEPERGRVRALVVFHGPLEIGLLALVAQIKPEEAQALARKLVDLGLADLDDVYLFPDPALGYALSGEVSAEEREGMEERWLRAILIFILLLSEMLHRNVSAAMKGASVVMRNLLAALATAETYVKGTRLPAEVTMNAVVRVQQIVRALGRPKVFGQLEEMRQRLEQQLGDWSHARFESAQAEIDELVHRRDANSAVQAARRLKARALAAGDVYLESAYDRAMASLLLGKALVETGRASSALPELDEAQKNFVRLVEAGNGSAANMLGGTAIWRGVALQALGRLELAAEAFRSAITNAELTGNARNAAIALTRLGMIRFSEKKLREALEIFERSVSFYEELREPEGVSSAWLNVGTVREEEERWDSAEEAYQMSLRIAVEVGSKPSQAAALGQMGVLYGRQGRFEDAAALQRQALGLREELGDTLLQIRSGRNLSNALMRLGRLDEARDVATRALVLSASLENSGEPWVIYEILEVIEYRAGNLNAALAARAKGRELFRNSRRDQGEPDSVWARLLRWLRSKRSSWPRR